MDSGRSRRLATEQAATHRFHDAQDDRQAPHRNAEQRAVKGAFVQSDHQVPRHWLTSYWVSPWPRFAQDHHFTTDDGSLKLWTGCSQI